MDLTYTKFYLEFKHPFGVSSNTRKDTLSIFVKLSDGSANVFGEACLPAYLGETSEDTILFFEKAKPVLKKFAGSKEALFHQLDLLSDRNNAAKAALNMALNDLYATKAGKPYYDVCGIGKSSAQATSFTIGIDAPDKLEQKIKEAADFKILKIKAGTADDKNLVNTIRQYTDKPLYVDVNQGWTDKHMVLEMLHWLKDQGVILVEQPMPKEMKAEMQWLSQRSPLPTMADESVKRLKDLEQLDGSFSGINIKLMKCTGLDEAQAMIAYCRKQGLKVLLGCMAESSCGTSAMAQLMKLADYIDLDAPLLYKNDPFTGITYDKGLVHLNDLPGLGVSPIAGGTGGFEI